MHEAIFNHLLTVIQKLSLARDQATIMSIVKSAARVLSGADGAAFVLREEGNCYYADEETISPLWKGQRFPMRICVSGWCMMQREAVVIEDIFQDARVPIDVYLPTFVRSLAMVPIRREDPIGVIGSYWARCHRPTNEELNMLQALADSVSIAMQNVQLYTELEQRIKQLKAADRAKDEFLMTLSHELRTPIQLIKGGAELLVMADGDKDSTQLALDCIMKGTEDQMHIVRDLLDSNHIMTGRLEINMQLLDLRPLVCELENIWQGAAEEKELALIFDKGPGGLWVRGDPHRLKQIFDNLLSNAIKFTPAGGRIELNIKREGPRICVQVSDSGEGMSAASIEHIFERFVRSDAAANRRHGGLGLGLSLAKHLVEFHGGSLEATSEGVDCGTIFTVRLPYAYAEDLPRFQDRSRLES